MSKHDDEVLIASSELITQPYPYEFLKACLGVVLDNTFWFLPSFISESLFILSPRVVQVIHDTFSGVSRVNFRHLAATR